MGLGTRHVIHYVHFDPSLIQVPIRVARPAEKGDVTSLANYARLFLAETLPSVSKIISLDADMIVQTDIGQLWDQPIHYHLDHFMAAALRGTYRPYATDFKFFHSALKSEMLPTVEQLFHAYYGRDINMTAHSYNAGLLVLDLNVWRRLGKTAEVEYWMRKHHESAKPLWELGLIRMLMCEWCWMYIVVNADV